MKSDPNHREQMEVRIVALLMGESSPFETAEIQAAMQKDPQLAAFHDEMRRTIDLVAQASKVAAQAAEQPKLSPERRQALFSQFREKKVIKFPYFEPIRKYKRWLVPVSVAAGFMILAGWALVLNAPRYAVSAAKNSSLPRLTLFDDGRAHWGEQKSRGGEVETAGPDIAGLSGERVPKQGKAAAAKIERLPKMTVISGVEGKLVDSTALVPSVPSVAFDSIQPVPAQKIFLPGAELEGLDQVQLDEKLDTMEEVARKGLAAVEKPRLQTSHAVDAGQFTARQNGRTEDGGGVYSVNIVGYTNYVPTPTTPTEPKAPTLPPPVPAAPIALPKDHWAFVQAQPLTSEEINGDVSSDKSSARAPAKSPGGAPDYMELYNAPLVATPLPQKPGGGPPSQPPQAIEGPKLPSGFKISQHLLLPSAPQAIGGLKLPSGGIRSLTQETTDDYDTREHSKSLAAGDVTRRGGGGYGGGGGGGFGGGGYGGRGDYVGVSRSPNTGGGMGGFDDADAEENSPAQNQLGAQPAPVPAIGAAAAPVPTVNVDNWDASRVDPSTGLPISAAGDKKAAPQLAGRPQPNVQIGAKFAEATPPLFSPQAQSVGGAGASSPLQPGGLPESSRRSESAQTSGLEARREQHPGGVPELTPSPLPAVRLQGITPDTHGTHVAGTIAGGVEQTKLPAIGEVPIMGHFFFSETKQNADAKKSPEPAQAFTMFLGSTNAYASSSEGKLTTLPEPPSSSPANIFADAMDRNALAALLPPPVTNAPPPPAVAAGPVVAFANKFEPQKSRDSVGVPRIQGGTPPAAASGSRAGFATSMQKIVTKAPETAEPKSALPEIKLPASQTETVIKDGAAFFMNGTETQIPIKYSLPSNIGLGDASVQQVSDSGLIKQVNVGGTVITAPSVTTQSSRETRKDKIGLMVDGDADGSKLNQSIQAKITAPAKRLAEDRTAPQDKPVNFNESLPAGVVRYSDANAAQVLDLYQELSGRTVLRPPSNNLPDTKLNIRSQTELTRGEAVKALDSILSMNGVSMTPQGEKYAKAITEAKLQTSSMKFAGEAPDSSVLVNQIVKVTNAPPADVAKALAPFSRAPNGIMALPDSPLLVIRDTPEKVKQMLDVVGRLDVKPDSNKADPKPVPRAPLPVPTPQPEITTRDNAFSTFSLNVSDVSFKLAASSLENGALPEAGSIRVEEFVNAFNYRDPAPKPGARLAFAWERARYPFAHNRDVLRFSIQTAARGRESLKPLNLVLLMDCSGSMERPDRIAIMNEALKVLAQKLQPQDKISVVAFARTARLWVDGMPGGKPKDFLDKVIGLNPEGGTNLEDAMNLAYATALRHFLAQGVNRVILLTDGAANLGNIDPEILKQKVIVHRAKGIALDCFGIGWEGYNDDLLEILSRNGDGRYGFIDHPEDAAPEFANQLAGALNVAASDVKAQVEFNPARVSSWRQIGYAKHQLTKEQFRDNTVDAAEIAAAESGNALYVIQVNNQGSGPLGTVRARYKVPATGNYVEQEWQLPYQPQVLAMEQATPAIRLASTAAGLGEWLSRSPYAAEVTLPALQRNLAGIPETYSPDPRPQRLAAMLRQAQALAGK